MLPITGNDLLELIPQKPPFVMIDKLLSVDNKTCVTAFTVLADNVLCDNGKLNVSGLMENIAQTAAAMSGYDYKQQGKTPGTGFIGDIRKFVYSALPAVGDEIITEVRIDNEVFDVTLISGKVKLNNEEIASCNMKIFRMAAATT